MCSKADTLKSVSKFLSYILRHCPESIGLTLDAQGWALVDDVLEKAPAKYGLTRELLNDVVVTNDKQRFKLSEDGAFIRASQGHSIPVELNLSAMAPPDVLFHGTATRFLASIMASGLKVGQRQHVHLSADIPTAVAVGRRYGKVVILTVDAAAMYTDGYAFYFSENGVWLSGEVPAKYLQVGEAAEV